MGEAKDRDDDSAAEWQAMVDLGEAHDEFRELGQRLEAGGSPPSGPSVLAKAPIIIDTDIGGDPDDAFALAVAALTVPELAMVITTDECQGQRARFARHFLDLLGRREVPVVRGSDLGNTRYFCVDGLTPADVPDQADDVVAAVSSVCSSTAGPVRWVGMGPVSNLSALLTHRRDLVEQLAITQMGGALAYRDATRAEHNFRLDPEAAIHLMHEVQRPTLVVSDVTFNTAIEIAADSPIYTQLAAPDAPSWAQLLRAHLDRWMATFYPSSIQHDGLTLAAALLWPGVRFGRERVAIDELARMSRSNDGVEVKLSISADYEDFMGWLASRLTQSRAVTST